MITRKEAAFELLRRRHARKSFADYLTYTNPKFIKSSFSEKVCVEVDKFIEDVQKGLRPVVILQAPPQHGKSEMASRRLPAYIMGRFPMWRIGAASYSGELADTMSQAVRRNMAADEHQRLFPHPIEKKRYDFNRVSDFTAPGGDGSYIGVGIGKGLSGRPVDVGIIDDPIKDHQEALSEVTKEGVWNWYQAVFKFRLSENSGQILMATSWAQDDLLAKVSELHRGDPRLTILRFPALNESGEVGYNPDLPTGALIPELHSETQLRELEAETSEYWWAALYQQSPQALGGNVFKDKGIKYYLPKDLPEKFDKMCASWDCTFKDTDGTDFVVGQVWGKAGANSYLLAQIRARMSFTKTVEEVIVLHEEWPRARAILIEDKANGPAVIDTLKSKVPGILPIEPDGSKLARAHAVTSYWEAGNVWLPHPDLFPWVKDLISEVLAFPAGTHDDQVDAMTQALRWLYPLFNRLNIKQEALNKAMGKR